MCGRSVQHLQDSLRPLGFLSKEAHHPKSLKHFRWILASLLPCLAFLYDKTLDLAFMDPLSLTASIITILGVGGEAAKAVKKFARLKGAPDIVLALHNELSDLQLVITAIETAFKTQEMTSTPFPGYRAHEVSVEASIVCSLQQVKEKALELEALHKKLRPALLEPSTPTPRNIRKRIWLVEHKVMKRLQEDLRSARLKLVAALGLLNS